MEDVMAHLEMSSGSAVGAGFAFTADEVEGALAHAQAARGVDRCNAAAWSGPMASQVILLAKDASQQTCGYTTSCCTVPQHWQTCCADLLA